MNREPKYVKVYESIKNRILNGDYKVGELIPPEPELESLYNVSRTTVRKAISMLAMEGFVYIQQGSGTEVIDYRTTQNLNYVTSFSETMRGKGYEVSSQHIRIDFVKAPEFVYRSLKIDPQSDLKLVHIERLMAANKRPIAIMANYIVPDIIPQIEKKAGMIKSLYEFLETEYNIRIDSAVEYITAVSAGREEAEVLNVPINTPLLLNRRITYSKTRPIEVVILKVIAEKYEYCVYMKDRPPKA